MKRPKTPYVVASSVSRPGPPRPRRKLPDAFRAAGVDEQNLAECFAEQLEQLRSGESKPRIPRKLLLDYLKECVRIIYAPARRGAESEQPATVELVHFVPRPDRGSDAPPPESKSSGEVSRPTSSESQVSQANLPTEGK